MRVLKERILVAIKAMSSNVLIPTNLGREGRVEVSGSVQINPGDTVMFGENFEEIEIEKKKFLLMNETNVKIIYDGPNGPEGKILPFLTNKEAVNV